jgi:hypothetical protein
LLKKDFLNEMFECNYVKNFKIVKQMKKEYLYEIVNKYSILFYSINYLLVIMDEKMTFSEHVNVMVAKAFVRTVRTYQETFIRV